MNSLKFSCFVLLFLFVFVGNLYAKCPKYIENLTLFDINGKPANVSCSFHTALIINFWATWCAPCKSEIPHLAEIYKEYKQRGIDVIGICIERSIQAKNLKLSIKSLKIPYPVYITRIQEMENKLGVRQIPETIIFNGNGKIYRRLIGNHSKDEIATILEELIKKRGEKD